MRARSTAVSALISFAFLLFSSVIALGSLSLRAQQPVSNASASSGPALPANVQAKLVKLQDDLKTAQDKDDAKAEALTFNAIGNIYFGVSACPQALDNYNRALKRARVAKNTEQQAAALNGMGDCYVIQSQNGKALETYQEALDVATASGDLRGQAVALSGLGVVNRNTGKLQKALEFHNRALLPAHNLKDANLEGAILLRIGVVYWNLSDPLQALNSYNRALPLFRSVGNRNNEAGALGNIGIAYYVLGEMNKALDAYNQVLKVFREIGSREGEAKTLANIGLVYSQLGEKQEALDFYRQALPIYTQVGSRSGEASTQTNMGLVYNDLGETQKALECYNRALEVFRQIADRNGEAATLNSIGNVYSILGDPEKALEYQSQALPIEREVGNRDSEAMTLISIGNIDSDLRKPQQALDSYNEALPIFRQIGDRAGEAGALTDVGSVYSDLGELHRAIDYFGQALPIYEEAGDRDSEAVTLNNLGDVYRSLGDPQKALELYNRALPIATAINEPLNEASIFHSLMLNQKIQDPSLAIFYGKQAVNYVQQVRGNITGLNAELQKSFLSSKSDYFHDLANLLIDQGRLPEAQQVLDLLKQQEYSDYVRGEKVEAASSLSLTPAERQAEEDYQKSTAQLVSLGEQWSDLKKIDARTPEQEKQYQQLSDQLTKASLGMNDYYSRLYALFGQNSEANRQVADVKGDVSLLKQTIAKMPHTVALYTLVGKDHYSVIVITPAVTVAREYAITEKDLNQKVAAYQEELRNPLSDARAAALELYKILMSPIEADLNQAHAQTLVWSLDGILRYVPIAALFDGKQYIVEKYATVTITPVSIAHLGDKPDFSNVSALAMGISSKYQEDLPALPAVAGELNEIVKDARVPGADGILPGTILLNSAFTEKAMDSQLSGQHSIVHIASHFVFRPGDDSQSYLLMAGKDEAGGGFHLTVADFRDDQELSLDDTDLLTLSACETGMSGSAANGREVDGLGTTAQLKGAKAVISSLWEVNDASTGDLMADFYKRWANGKGKTPKVEALRSAQLDLLQGKVTPHSGASGRGVSAVEDQPAGQNSAAGYAHPYYWAPFVLMGNWR